MQNTANDRMFLTMALKEAEGALAENTYPVGAVIVDEQNNVIARGRNRVHIAKDATAHAEIDAIRNAGQVILDAKVSGRMLTIYSSLEPCPMCTGAILFSHIRRAVWLKNDEEGFGGYRKIKNTMVFDRRFSRVVMEKEPFDDLKQQQEELMNKWAENPYNVVNLRKAGDE
ncbi:nucleoside deaminase [Sediminibacillus albus]|uniref:tRNA(Adenine34) deaminase n=1 Tax=Sediminibacillus albus TaxID=407036 RepID=A0A1G8WPB7_9BACI|nr:nucleoside deaminase [Sediminibacillus albus]SDJ79470.1 tRNA(adenine34) deaminase [Sediminibacillus albus]